MRATTARQRRKHSNTAKKLSRLCAAFIFLTGLSVPCAAYSVSDDISFRTQGFGTAGVTFSDSDNTGVRRRNDTPTAAFAGEPDFGIDSNLGLQFSADYNNVLSFTTQLLLREQYDTNLEDYIHFAFASFTPKPWVTLRAGRLPIDAYYMSDSANIAYTNPFVRPPPNFYGQVIFHHFKGGDIALRQPIARGVLELRGAYGRFDAIQALTEDAIARIDMRDFSTATVIYNRESWTYRYSFLRTVIHSRSVSPEHMSQLAASILPVISEMSPDAVLALSDFSNAAHSEVNKHALTLVRDDGQTLLQSEISKITYGEAKNSSYRSGYVAFGWYKGAFMPYAMISRIISKGRYDSATGTQTLNSIFKKQRLSAQLAISDITANMVTAAANTTYSLGLRWDFAKNLAFKVQYEHHDLESGFLMAVKPNKVLDKKLNTLSLNIDFIF